MINIAKVVLNLEFYDEITTLFSLISFNLVVKTKDARAFSQNIFFLHLHYQNY